MSTTTECANTSWGFTYNLKKMMTSYSRKKWKNRLVNLNQFHILNTIGKGTFGKVHIVQHKITGKRFTLKYMDKSKIIEMNACNNVIKERSILESIHHPFLANLKYSFQDEKYLYLVTELMLGGDLRFLLNQMQKAEENVVRFWCSQLILIINYIHSKDLIHRDIKPENLLIDEYGYLNLSDFNVSCHFRSSDSLLTAHVGTPHYMAPELLNKTGYNQSVDWWSLGVTLYELLVGKKPFICDQHQTLFQQIQYNELKFPSNCYISKDAKSFISGLLTKNPDERLGAGDHGLANLMNHPWMRGADWGDALLNREIESPFEPDLNQCNYDDIYEIENVIFDENLKVQQKKKRRQKSLSMINGGDTSRLSTSTVSSKSKFTLSSRNSSISPTSSTTSNNEFGFDSSLMNQLPQTHHHELTEIDEDLMSMELEFSTFDYHSQPKVFKYSFNQFGYNV